MMQHTLLGDGVTEGAHLADNYMVRATKDGHIASMAISDRQFPLLCRALGTERWLDDPRFATMAERERNMDALSPLIGEEFSRYTTNDLVDRLHAEDVPCAATTPVADVHRDRQSSTIATSSRASAVDRPDCDRSSDEVRAHARRTRSRAGIDRHTDEIWPARPRRG
jgi:crotonobetainyl-CoA:carnitine CoA-transferase CaiB-like acyl-CoA transferase